MDDANEASRASQSGVPIFQNLRPASENDRLLAALGYVFWIIVPAIVLLTDLRRSAFAFVHALQGLVFGGASVLFVILYSCVTIVLSAAVPLLGCVLWLGYFLPLVLGIVIAYQVYTTNRTEFPLLSDLTRSLFGQQLRSVVG
jgi:uncharacterized membrane protein